jgi:hypothetical protein
MLKNTTDCFVGGRDTDLPQHNNVLFLGLSFTQTVDPQQDLVHPGYRFVLR